MAEKIVSYKSPVENASNSVRYIQKRNFFILYLLTLFAFPLSSYVTGFIGIESNFISIVSRFITCFFAIYYIFFLIKYRLFKVIPLFWLFLFFWLIYGVRILYDTLLHGDQLGMPVPNYYLFGFVLSFLVSIPLFVPVDYQSRKVEILILGILLIINILGLYNNLSVDTLLAERLGGNERLNPITYGMHGAWLVVTALVFLLNRKLKNYFKVIASISIPIGMANLFIAASKSPFLFLALSVLIMIVFFLKRAQWKKFSFFFIIGLLLWVLSIRLGLVAHIGLALDRFSEIGVDESSVLRAASLRGAWKQFLDSPFLGSFLEERIIGQYPHNMILESFMALGIVGGFLFLVFFIIALIDTFFNIYKTRLSLISFICFSSAVLSLFSGSLSFSSDYWNSMAVMTSTAFLLRNRNWIKPAKPLIHEDI